MVDGSVIKPVLNGDKDSVVRHFVTWPTSIAWFLQGQREPWCSVASGGIFALNTTFYKFLKIHFVIQTKVFTAKKTLMLYECF